MKRRFLVTGATGLQGGATARSLLDEGHFVRALTRNTSAPAAVKLAAAGVEVVRGDFDDADSLKTALKSMNGAFLVTNFVGGNASVESEERQGKAFVDAAVSAGLEHLVFSSVGSAERNTGVPHFESKWRIEQHARSSGLAALSIVRPVFFMENFRFPFVLRALFVGALRTVLGEQKQLQMVAARDIGRVAARMLIEGPSQTGVTVELAGDALTIGEITSAYREITGNRLFGAPMPRFLLQRMPAELSTMLLWFGSDGYKADLPSLRAKYPFLLSFRDWLEEGNRL
jgi:uncharacterized protein YbjT (DUF2867 family)